MFNNLHAHLGTQVNAVEPPLVEVTSQPQPIIEDEFTTINTSSTPREITPLTAFALIGVSEEHIQELLHLQLANLEETMERRFLAECAETNMLIKNTLESSLKFFNDSMLFNINLLMQQRLPPSAQSSTTIPTPTTIVNHVFVPPPSPPKSFLFSFPTRAFW